ncbi:HDIG domain-containing protein [candidate division GN15 bacterium]|nr:HDIG domain-containing protein [candidate division GN15 bacterium]
MCRLSGEVVDDIIEAGRIYEVGGAVRDQLLYGSLQETDLDYLVTGVPYDRLSQILKRHGRVDLVGRSFGVIKFTQHVKGRPVTFDITLPRTEHSTGIGHRDFEVRHDPELPVEADLVRRDFTINAMALALDTHDLVDPLGGREDLELRQLRIVYPESFKDDPLRMLRAVQFAARFEFSVELETFRLMREHAELIATVSPERIAEELNKLLVRADNPSIGFRLMQASGLMQHVLPELEECVGVDQPGGYHRYTVFEHIIRTIDECPKRLHLRLAALFHDINKPQAKRIVEKGATFYGHEHQGADTARRVMKRLRYGNDMIAKVGVLVDRHMFTTDVTPKGLRRLVRRVGTDLIFDLLDLRRADVVAQGMGGTTEDVDEFEADIRAEIDRKSPFGVKDLQIDGGRVMEILGIEPGPLVGEVLEYLLEAVLDEPEKNNPEQLGELARKYYKEKNKDV